MRFSKAHGLGNDFIIVDGFREQLPPDLNKAARKLCDRHFGIGADGLVLVLPSHHAEVMMRIYNSDGSEAEMCGNAIRCFARFVYESGYVQNNEFMVETLAGVMSPRLVLKNGAVVGVTVDMGAPSFARKDIPMRGQPEGQALQEPLEVLGRTFDATCLLLGVPHCVIFVDDVDKIELEKYGPHLEKHPAFPRKINVHFVEIINDREMKMRVWERGAGVTLACGTGACGALVAAAANNKISRKAAVRLPGGTLEVEWAGNNHVYMTGPAQLVYCGEIQDKSLLE